MFKKIKKNKKYYFSTKDNIINRVFNLRWNKNFGKI